MSQLFEDEKSDSDIEIKTNSEYAKNYNAWRQKEEFHKLTTKYKNDTEESSSSSDDENVEVEKFEQEFFKTLSYLKKKDPRIYNKNFGCFKNAIETTKDTKFKKEKDSPIFVKDYERQLLLDRNGEVSDDNGEDEQNDNNDPTYTEKQQILKEDLKNVLNDIKEEEDSGDENWGGIFKPREKTLEETVKEEDDYKLWLTGQKDHLECKNDEGDLKPLKDYWANPKLDAKEKFLRDYILHNRFMESENDDYIPTYDEIVHDSDELSEDEKILDTQDEFEHKYNFRYEDPDQEFIKRYPRSMEQSLRQKDDKRKIKRAERKTRKELEKQDKMEEIKQLKALKRQEIEEKIQKLQEVTGNTELGFNITDIDKEFDPEEHDKRMQELFNTEFYSGPEGDAKPEFPELDEELQIEKWDDWRGDEKTAEVNEAQLCEVHCEDEEFNMDCDYDPDSHHKELIINSKKKKHRPKSKFAKLVSEPKPLYDPDNKTYQEYLDEYYQLDCEDVIGDIQCRFRYRTVVPNDFGLSVEEILMAKDKELNRWSSLKKAVQYRPEHVEKYDVMAFRKKAQNEHLKRKFIPSLFASTEEDETTRPTTSESTTKDEKVKKQQRANVENVKHDDNSDNNNEEIERISSKEFTTEKKNKRTEKDKTLHVENKQEQDDEFKTETTSVIVKKTKKRKVKEHTDVMNTETEKKRIKMNKTYNAKHKNKKQNKNLSNVDIGITDARLEAYGINPKKYKNKLKYRNKN